MPNKNQHLFNALQQLQQQQQNCVLATIIETFGSTYQKAGARMLITQQGELLGLLGGGCFERDLVEHAQSVLATGTPKTVFYDMRSPEDVIWGLGLGCNGAVRVMLQRLNLEDNFTPLPALVENAERNTAGVLITVNASEHPDFPAGRNWFIPTAATGKPQLLSPAPFLLTTAALQTLLQQKPRLETHQLEGKTIQAFYDPVHPPLRLLILGAGADSLPVVQCAKALGWRVNVVDYRPAYLKPERFPLADQLLTLNPEELTAHLDLDSHQAVVLMTHNVDYDQRYLQALLNCHIPYIGLLGPAARRDRLLNSLGAEAQKLTARVYGPVGLDIGAETPEEIALSIMAGIHSALKHKTGKQLHTLTTTVPDVCLPG